MLMESTVVVERRMTERRSGIEHRRQPFASFAGSKRKCWERRSYMNETDRRQTH